MTGVLLTRNEFRKDFLEIFIRPLSLLAHPRDSQTIRFYLVVSEGSLLLVSPFTNLHSSTSGVPTYRAWDRPLPARQNDSELPPDPKPFVSLIPKGWSPCPTRFQTFTVTHRHPSCRSSTTDEQPLCLTSTPPVARFLELPDTLIGDNSTEESPFDPTTTVTISVSSPWTR